MGENLRGGRGEKQEAMVGCLFDADGLRYANSLRPVTHDLSSP